MDDCEICGGLPDIFGMCLAGCDNKSNSDLDKNPKTPEADVLLNNLLNACIDLEEIQGVYDKDPWACGERGDMAEKWNEAIKNVVKETRAWGRI